MEKSEVLNANGQQVQQAQTTHKAEWTAPKVVVLGVGGTMTQVSLFGADNSRPS